MFFLVRDYYDYYDYDYYDDDYYYYNYYYYYDYDYDDYNYYDYDYYCYYYYCLWTFFRSDLIDVNSFDMNYTFLACLHGCMFEICSFLKKNNYIKTQVIDDGK